MNTAGRKKLYLEEQKRIAEPFARLGGDSLKLANVRIEEANRVVNLSDSEFEDYVQDWVYLS